MIDGVSVVDLTPAALLGITVLLLLLGRIVPRTTYLEKSKEADQWRQAYEAERSARLVSDAQTRELLELARASETFLSAVFKYSEELKSGDT